MTGQTGQVKPLTRQTGQVEEELTVT